jgi:hypothetical protein
MVHIHEVDVAVGDVLHFGGTTVTVIDIDNGEVTFRIDNNEPMVDDDCVNGCTEEISVALPR